MWEEFIVNIFKLLNCTIRTYIILEVLQVYQEILLLEENELELEER